MSSPLEERLITLGNPCAPYYTFATKKSRVVNHLLARATEFMSYSEILLVWKETRTLLEICVQ